MPTVEELGGLGAEISDRAIDHLGTQLRVDKAFVNLYLRKQVQTRRAPLTVAGYTNDVPTPTESLQVFADLMPAHNWGHDAAHLYYHPDNGELLHMERSQFPPDQFEGEPDAFEPLHVPFVFPEEPSPGPTADPTTPSFATNAFEPIVPDVAGTRYAILFSGNSNNRHLNDLEFLYRTLIDKYQFAPANITVLNYDGTLNYSGPPHPVGNWPGDNTPYRLNGHIDGAGTKQTFEQALATVAGKLGSSDQLLIHTNNHGGETPEPWLCGYPNYAMVFKASDWGPLMAQFPAFGSLVVSMEQCFSGGFMTPTINNSTAAVTSFAAAVPANKSSAGGPNFDPWARDWIAAFNGKYPNGSPLQRVVNPPVSARAAFDYSDAVHVPMDDPVYQDRPTGSGSNQYI